MLLHCVCLFFVFLKRMLCKPAKVEFFLFICLFTFSFRVTHEKCNSFITWTKHTTMNVIQIVLIALVELVTVSIFRYCQSECHEEFQVILFYYLNFLGLLLVALSINQKFIQVFSLKLIQFIFYYTAFLRISWKIRMNDDFLFLNIIGFPISRVMSKGEEKQRTQKEEVGNFLV